MRLPVISGYQLIKILTRCFGFRIIRQRGSHVTLTNDVSFITIPMHSELAIGTLKSKSEAKTKLVNKIGNNKMETAANFSIVISILLAVSFKIIHLRR